MQIGFPTTPTRDGSWWTGVAELDDTGKMEDEKKRLHEINKAWFDENCDDACKTAGVNCDDTCTNCDDACRTAGVPNCIKTKTSES